MVNFSKATPLPSRRFGWGIIFHAPAIPFHEFFNDGGVLFLQVFINQR